MFRLLRWLKRCRWPKELRHLPPPESLILACRLRGWEELEMKRTGLWWALSAPTLGAASGKDTETSVGERTG